MWDLYGYHTHSGERDGERKSDHIVYKKTAYNFSQPSQSSLVHQVSDRWMLLSHPRQLRKKM